MKKISDIASTAVALVLAGAGLSAQSQTVSVISKQGGEDYQNVVVDIHQDKVGAQYLFMSTYKSKWVTGVYQWYFNPANLPANISQDSALLAMKTAAARWEQMCYLTIQYMGTTAVLGNQNVVYKPDDGFNVWGFQPFDPAINAFSGWTPTTSSSTGAILGADIILNSNVQWTAVGVEGVMTHEIGHGIGIGHSDVAASIMSNKPYHDVQYMRTLRGDDADGCAYLYGANPMAMANRTMNWAENEYASLLKSGPSPDGSYSGYLYRYYPQSNSYTGYKDGNAYYMGPDGNIQNLGPLSGYTSRVTAAGF